jgi:hypothetical protein
MDHDFVEAGLFVVAKILNDFHRAEEFGAIEGLAFEDIAVCAAPENIDHAELGAGGILENFVDVDKAVAIHLGFGIWGIGIGLGSVERVAEFVGGKRKHVWHDRVVRGADKEREFFEGQLGHDEPGDRFL